MNKYDKALTRFTGDYDCADWTRLPRKSGNKIIATETHIIIRVDADKCEGEYDPHHNQPDNEHINRIFPKPNCDLYLDVHEIAKCINAVDDEISFDVTGENAKCDECFGKGYVTWEYEGNNETHYHDFDCPVCDGRGRVNKKTRQRSDLNIEINGAKYYIGMLMPVLETIYALGHDTAHVVAHSKSNVMMIAVEPGVDIAIMCNYLDDEYTVASYTLKKSPK